MLLACSAQAQWTVTSLQPAGVSGSTFIDGGIDGKLSGRVSVGSQMHAAYWDLAAGTFVDLHSTGSYSFANAAGGGVQGGSVGVRAAMWTGTPGSFIDLHPAGYTSSQVNAISGDLQVGMAGPRAGFWNGSAASWVDLNPITATNSMAYAAYGNMQGGSANFAGRQCAGVWSGTPESFVDHSPPTAKYSLIIGMYEDAKGGFVIPSGTNKRAAYWPPQQTQWVNFHPASYQQSEIHALAEGVQVGWVANSEVFEASLWFSTAASRVDLHAMLPAGSQTSSANAVWIADNTLYVAGFGGGGSVPMQARLWSLPLPCPADFDGSGFVDTDDYDAFVQAFEAGTDDADFDESGFVDTDDFDAFAEAFEAGC
jgi:hypothetical protein